MSVKRFGLISLLLLSACSGMTSSCPKVSQWWYDNCPDTEWSGHSASGIRHDPSTITSVGGHGRK